METRQLPMSNGCLRQPTLISTLRRALAKCAACEIREVITKMWEILTGLEFVHVDNNIVGKLVNGELVN